MSKRNMTTLISAAMFVLASCQSTEPYTPPDQQPPVVTPVPPSVGAFESSGHLKLDAWRIEFAERARVAGHSVEVIRSVLDGIEPMRQFLELKSAPVDQAEFSKPIWEYVDDTVSRSRLTNGRQRLANDATLFAALENNYKVQKQYLAAIWGMETSYGAVIGNFDAPSVLASMATEGRRQSFAENELLALMTILASGDAYRHELIAGWVRPSSCRPLILPTRSTGRVMARKMSGGLARMRWRPQQIISKHPDGAMVNRLL